MFSRIRQFIARFEALWRPASLDRDLDAEMASHLQFAIDENAKNGLSPQEAERQARISFGGPQQARENHRDSRGLPFLDSVLQDLRFALRLFRKAPSFSVSAIFTLALGIGATTAIFSVVYGVLLRPLPYPNPDRIARLWEQGTAGNRMNFADPNFEDIRSQNKSLLAVAEYNSLVSTVSGSIEPARLNTASVSSDFFAVLGVHPVFGRSFARSCKPLLLAPIAQFHARPFRCSPENQFSTRFNRRSPAAGLSLSRQLGYLDAARDIGAIPQPQRAQLAGRRQVARWLPAHRIS